MRPQIGEQDDLPDECLTESEILGLVGRRAQVPQGFQQHIDRCPSCRAVFAELVRSQRTVRLPRARVTRMEGASLIRGGNAEDDLCDRLCDGEVIAERFVLEGKLGSGAMGVVWAATDRTHGERVALKFLRSASKDDHEKRLRREAAVLQALRHPNIVSLRDVVDALPWGPVLVMDLLEGTQLEGRLRERGALSMSELTPIALDVLRALGAAHARGVVHRDLKPQNIFLDSNPSGPARVLDFGMAKIQDALGVPGVTPSITRRGVIMGTPFYMAPEQVFGAADVDSRADLWAFGVIVYRALSGRLPVAAKNYPELMRALGARRMLPFVPANPVPEVVTRLLTRLLSVEREERTRHVDEAMAIFEALAKGGMSS